MVLKLFMLSSVLVKRFVKVHTCLIHWQSLTENGVYTCLYTKLAKTAGISIAFSEWFLLYFLLWSLYVIFMCCSDTLFMILLNNKMKLRR